MTTSWTCTRTVEVANGGWRRGHRRHFSEVFTDVTTVIQSFPLLSSAMMLGMFYSVLETLYVCVSELRLIVCLPSNPPLIGCEHSSASKKVRLFVKRLPCDWLKSPPVTALYWFKCLTFFFKGEEKGRDCWPVGQGAMKGPVTAVFIGCFSFKKAQLKKKVLPSEPKEIFIVNGFSQVTHLC